MFYVSDRNLLIHEPKVFEEISFVSQLIIHEASCDYDGYVLTSTSIDLDVYPICVADVVILNDKPYEIVEVISATKLRLSQVRASITDPYIKGIYCLGGKFSIATFKHQAVIVHKSLLLEYGIDEDDLRSFDTLQALETVAILAKIYTAAIHFNENGDLVLKDKANYYQTQYASLKERLVLDVNSKSGESINHKIYLGCSQLKRL